MDTKGTIGMREHDDVSDNIGEERKSGLAMGYPSMMVVNESTKSGLLSSNGESGNWYNSSSSSCSSSLSTILCFDDILDQLVDLVMKQAIW